MPWYHSSLTREEAERKLYSGSQTDGKFLYVGLGACGFGWRGLGLWLESWRQGQTSVCTWAGELCQCSCVQVGSAFLSAKGHHMGKGQHW